MDGVKVRIRVEIVPASEVDGVTGEAGSISYVDEEAVRKVPAAQAASLEDMEEVLLGNAYEVKRRALGEHFAKVSRRGLSSGPSQAN